MKFEPRQISLEQWDEQYERLRKAGLREPEYGGPISRHVEDGDYRLLKLRYDNSAASLRLWNFLLTEEERLRKARAGGKKIVGTMKDLGTVPVMAYAFENVVAFYPDGAWWIPCVMELSAGLLGVADSLGIDESFCPVRAMLGAFVTGAHFPIPDRLICSVGATCDDFSAIAQRLNGLGYPILWWEIPHRRRPEPDEEAVELPGGFAAPKCQVEFVKSELGRVKDALEQVAGRQLDEERLWAGIRKANEVRRYLGELRRVVFTAKVCPLPALEMLIAEMLAIHFCSDRDETIMVLKELVAEVKKRVQAGKGVVAGDAAKIFWVNPVADLQVMNLLEECGGRICGTEYLFSHGLDVIPEDVPAAEALARTALADPMAGAASDRAERVCADIRGFGAEAVVISRIPGASHCALEGEIIGQIVQAKLGVPVVEIEVPPVADSVRPTLGTRLEALVETVKQRRTK
ncbi:MAG: 2-hydroxyacyl-CoA dehydratase [Planctomycetota bacterium]|jgi:benzoyl-CoA reductase/2-hydroxyglutaryl-CoA dehydratase subunit BcrC/BadD/HgdB